jgi:lipopolysaccharide transport system ATP-binding protein
MGDVAEKEGRTVLFVSHNMATIQNLCAKVFLLYQGNIQYNGKTLEGVEKYLLSNSTNYYHCKDDLILKSFNIINKRKERITTIQPNDSVELVAHIEVDQKLFNPSFGYGIVNMFGERITTLHTSFQFPKSWQIESKVLIKVLWKNCKVCPGEYKIMAALYDGNQKIKIWDEITTITIESTDYYQTGKMPQTGYQGWLLSDAEWTITSI